MKTKQLIELNPIEKKRTYHWIDDNRKPTVFENVTHFCNSETTHRLRLSNDILIIVPTAGLNFIEIETKQFTL